MTFGVHQCCSDVCSSDIGGESELSVYYGHIRDISSSFYLHGRWTLPIKAFII